MKNKLRTIFSYIIIISLMLPCCYVAFLFFKKLLFGDYSLPPDKPHTYVIFIEHVDTNSKVIDSGYSQAILKDSHLIAFKSLNGNLYSEGSFVKDFEIYETKPDSLQEIDLTDGEVFKMALTTGETIR